MGEENFRKLGKFGYLECIYPTWFLITKKLTIKEAVEKYGTITELAVGPRGGFKSVTFGEKKFITRQLDSRDEYSKEIESGEIKVIVEK